MKLLVLSDSQIGGGFHLTDDRLAEQEAMLGQIAELAEAEEVQVVVHCGDVFDSRHPSEEARMVWKRFASDLYGRSRDLLIVAGNHDLRNAELPSSLDLYDDGLFVRHPRVVRESDFELARNEPAFAIACLPWVPDHRRASARETREGIREEMAELLVRAAADLRAQCESGVPAVLAAHWPISGARLPSGIPVEQLGMVVLPLTELEAQGWDAVVAGDIHVPMVLSPGTLSVDGNGSHHAAGQPVISVGPTWIGNWGEEATAHGVWVLEAA